MTDAQVFTGEPIKFLVAACFVGINVNNWEFTLELSECELKLMDYTNQ